MGKFGILFQNAALLDSLTVEENLKFCKNNNFKKILNDVALPQSLLKNILITSQLVFKKELDLLGQFSKVQKF